MKTIDLNADVGEGMAWDTRLIPLVTSANIACGAHAGDELSMENAARAAIEHGVAIGAHPGHEDRENFGRKELPITPVELQKLLHEQVDRLHRKVAGLGGSVRYLKLHGALYHQAGRDPTLAATVIDFLSSYHTPLELLCQTATELFRRAEEIDVANAEAFPDRRYLPDGSLMPRTEPGAVLTEPKVISAQAIKLAPTCESLCLHGDNQQSFEAAIRVRSALEASGYQLQAFTA